FLCRKVLLCILPLSLESIGGKWMTSAKRKAETRRVTLSDLRAGYYPFISEKEFAGLRGCSVDTLRKERTQKRGPKYSKDPSTGRIYYRAETVLEFFDSFVECTSTLDYDTTAKQAHLERARHAQTAS